VLGRVWTAGPDGNLWFTEYLGNKIGRITPAGTVTEFAISTSGSFPYGMTAGPDGNLWFTESGGNQIGHITPAGVVTEFPIPTRESSPDRSMSRTMWPSCRSIMARAPTGAPASSRMPA
jgi:virginiamycin B lyase